ncbi:hypothetical protein F7725_013457%2C partial [Xyrichtys novacula]|uniref:Uncharacterized protein n=1 Tax=Xyrichtys novacula TaxID=13765 RepID=A0AAV1FXX1_XYRNO|nr:hypothetical protein F7725_013457%2C partial [Xyrichtys novacula]
MAATITFPLTSPPRCDGCLEKSRSIAQLEHCIADLHWIRNEEKLLDSVITLGAVSKVVVHVGCNETARKQSELLKIDFRDLLRLLRTTGKAVFISGSIPTLARGAERFSRLLSLNTWLLSACRDYQVGFIDNFNLFWNRYSA